ncbi:hypothetical protein PIROE2DRAFT_6490 [Piromyces sp. E2]|nr:hypothetical protein PIROE2DRAFT_6490 [Piromyces sp. E2]|eukprot:OUM66343.1 hypothetical protein PIROE2DRAFT_6490 [Piromyces sp. E2]
MFFQLYLKTTLFKRVCIDSENSDRKTRGSEITQIQMMRTLNKQYPSNIKTFDEIPDESKIFKIIRDEDFIIFKNPNVVIFQSSFQEKIYSQYSKDIFVYGTFSSTAPKYLVIMYSIQSNDHAKSSTKLKIILN